MKKLVLIFCLSILLLLIIPVFATHTGGIFPNDGFEDGTSVPPSSWSSSCTAIESIQTSGAPEGSNYYRIAAGWQQGCQTDSPFITSSPNWSIDYKVAAFYARTSATTCALPDGCFSSVTFAFGSDTKEVDYQVMIWEREPFPSCVNSAWDGSFAHFCDTIPASCFSLVSSSFCHFQKSDFFNSIQTLCGTNCLEQVELDSGSGVFIFSVKASANGGGGTQTSTTDFDEIYLGANAPSGGSPSSPTPSGTASTILLAAMVLIVFSIIVSAYEHPETAGKVAKYGTVAIIAIGLIFIVFQAVGL